MRDIANASSTYQYIDSNFQVEYGGGDGATGDVCFLIQCTTKSGVDVVKNLAAVVAHQSLS